MYFLRFDYVDRILDASFDVIDGDIWVVFISDFIERNTRLDKLQYTINWNSCPSNTRLSKVYIWINYGSIFTHFTSSLWLLTTFDKQFFPKRLADDFKMTVNCIDECVIRRG